MAAQLLFESCPDIVLTHCGLVMPDDIMDLDEN